MTRPPCGPDGAADAADTVTVVDAVTVEALVAALVPRLAEALAVPQRCALGVGEACNALGVSWDFWREHVEPEVRVVRRGRRKLVPTAELDRWLDENAERLLEDAAPGELPRGGPRGRSGSGSAALRASDVPARRAA